jgi:uncharacterized protein (TIGR03435 family)
VATGIGLRAFLSIAFGGEEPLRTDQILDLPAWGITERFDVIAKAAHERDLPPALATRSTQLPTLLQQLLTDRFKLVAHHDMRTLPVYALEVARKDAAVSSRFSRSTRDCGSINAARGTDREDRSLTESGAPLCAVINSFSSTVRVAADSVTMSDVVFVLGAYADRPVVDHTGLTGLFNFVLEFIPDSAQSPDVGAAPSFFTAVGEQLGLRLVPTEAPINVLVIDHVERPTPD